MWQSVASASQRARVRTRLGRLSASSCGVHSHCEPSQWRPAARLRLLRRTACAPAPASKPAPSAPRFVAYGIHDPPRHVARILAPRSLFIRCSACEETTDCPRCTQFGFMNGRSNVSSSDTRLRPPCAIHRRSAAGSSSPLHRPAACLTCIRPARTAWRPAGRRSAESNRAMLGVDAPHACGNRFSPALLPVHASRRRESAGAWL